MFCGLITLNYYFLSLESGERLTFLVHIIFLLKIILVNNDTFDCSFNFSNV